MSITSRVLLVGAVLCAATIAEARPHRIVVLEFDGPRELADRGRDAVSQALAEQYDLVTPKRWQDAREQAKHTVSVPAVTGPRLWAAAARAIEVDAVIEGWVEEEHGRPALSVVVRDAYDGAQLDVLQLALPLDDDGARELHDGLEDRLAWIEPHVAAAEPPPPPIAQPEPPQAGPGACYDIFGCDPPGEPVAKATRAQGRIYGGLYVDARSALQRGAVMQHDDASTQGFVVAGEVFPWSDAYEDGLRGFGVAFAIAGSVGLAGAAQQHDILAAAHYRRPFGARFAVDVETGFSHHSFDLDGSPALPDVTYNSALAGAHAEVALPHATFAAGGRYLRPLDTIATAGYSLDASVTMPLTRGAFLRGQAEYRRFAADDGMTTDATATAAVTVGYGF